MRDYLQETTIDYQMHPDFKKQNSRNYRYNGSQHTSTLNEDVKHNRDENTMQTENPTEEPTNGNISGTGMSLSERL